MVIVLRASPNEQRNKIACSMSVGSSSTEHTKCLICLDCASVMVQMDTEIDVDGIPESCSKMYSTFTRIEHIEALCEHSLRLCLPCLRQLNSCYRFLRQALESADYFIDFSHHLDDAANPTESDVPEASNESLPPAGSAVVLQIEDATHDTDTSNYDLLSETHAVSENETQTESTNAALIETTTQSAPSCEQCSSNKHNPVLLRQHTLQAHSVHLPNGLTECTVCGRKFKSARSFIRHSRTHQEEKQHRCQFCPKSFHYLQHLQVHERTHTHEKPYICCRCPKAFAAKDRLIAHERTHQGAYAFECEFCTRKFNTNKALSRHRLLKHDQAVQSFEPHGCSQCGQLLLSQSAASYHTRHQCVEEKKKMRTRQESVRCALCKQLFLTQHHLETHLAEWHGTQELEQHLQRNREKERTHKYPCEVCGRKFKQKIVLTRHRQRHDGVRPYRCEICGRTFVQKGTLKTHMRTHTDDKPFLCVRCGEGFRSAASRRYHWMKTGCEEDKPDDSTKDPPKSNNDINE